MKRTDVAVRRGAEVSKPPHDRGVEAPSHRDEQALAAVSFSQACSLRKACGGPVSRITTRRNKEVVAGPLWVCTREVKDLPLTWHGPISGNGNFSTVVRWNGNEALRKAG